MLTTRKLCQRSRKRPSPALTALFLVPLIFAGLSLYNGLHCECLTVADLQSLNRRIVVTLEQQRSLEVSLPYLYVAKPVATDREHVLYETARLVTDGGEEILLLSKAGQTISPNRLYGSVQYESLHAKWLSDLLPSASRVLVACQSSLPVGLALLGLVALMALAYVLPQQTRRSLRKTPFGRQLAALGDPDDVTRLLDRELLSPLFVGTALLVTDSLVILGSREHPSKAPQLIPLSWLNAATLTRDEDEYRLQLDFWDSPHQEEEAVWSCYLSVEEAQKLSYNNGALKIPV